MSDNGFQYKISANKHKIELLLLLLFLRRLLDNAMSSLLFADSVWSTGDFYWFFVVSFGFVLFSSAVFCALEFFVFVSWTVSGFFVSDSFDSLDSPEAFDSLDAFDSERFVAEVACDREPFDADFDRPLPLADGERLYNKQTVSIIGDLGLCSA